MQDGSWALPIMFERWDLISYISSGLTLTAFAIAIIFNAYRQKLLRDENIIRTASEADRATVVRAVLEFFDVDTRNLTKSQQYDIAIRQIDARAKRFYTLAICIVFIAILLAILSLFAIWQNANASSPTTAFHLRDLVKGDPIEYTLADSAGSAVQQFERGWMVANFSNNTFIAVTVGSPGRWIKMPAEYIKGSDPDCDNSAGDKVVRLGFCWFNKNLDSEFHSEMGAPIDKETRAYLQYQMYRDGLLIFGLPGSRLKPPNFEFQSIVGVFLHSYNDKKGGDAAFKVLNESVAPLKVYCSANWYPAQKDMALPDGVKVLIVSDACDRAIPSDMFTGRSPEIRIF